MTENPDYGLLTTDDIGAGHPLREAQLALYRAITAVNLSRGPAAGTAGRNAKDENARQLVDLLTDAATALALAERGKVAAVTAHYGTDA